MARRKRSNEGLISVLLELPWQVSAVLAVVAFIALKWMVPLWFKSPALISLAHVISGFAIWVAVGLLAISVISYLSHRKSTDFYSKQNIPKYSHPQHEREVKKSIAAANAILDRMKVPQIVKPTNWSIDLLRSLEWKRFEMLAAEYFRVLGKQVETISHGADGGIDARIYANESGALEYAVQCKAWNSAVGIKPVRELFGVMSHESAGKGIFISTSTFTEDAKSFAKDHVDKLFLVDGRRFISMIEMLPEEKKAQLLAFATEGDYTTPTCASCGIKMVRRLGKTEDFWGCQNFPKCKSTLKFVSV